MTLLVQQRLLAIVKFALGFEGGFGFFVPDSSNMHLVVDHQAFVEIES